MKRSFVSLFLSVTVIALGSCSLTSPSHSTSNNTTTYSEKGKDVYVVTTNFTDATIKAQADYVCDGINDEFEIQTAINAGTGGKIVCFGNFKKGVAAGITIPSNTTIELHGSIILTDNINVDGCIFTNSNYKDGNTNIALLGGANALLDGNEVNQSFGIQCGVIFKKVDGLNIDIGIKSFRTMDMQISGNCKNVQRNNRVLRQGNNLDVQIVDDCSDINGWNFTEGASVTLNSSYYLVGTRSLKYTNNGTELSTLYKTLSQPLDLSNKQIRIWLKIDTSDYKYFGKNSELQLRLYNGMTKYATASFQQSALMSDEYKGFHCVEISLSNFSPKSGFSDSDWSHITRIAFNQIIVGHSIDIFYGGIESITAPQQGVVSFSFDDSKISQYTNGLSEAEKYHYPLVVSVVGDFIEQSGHLTWRQLKEMDSLGYDIAQHGKTHSDLTELTITQMEYEFTYTTNIISQHGIVPRPYLNIPFGAYTISSEFYNSLRKYFTLIRSSGGPDSYTSCNAQPTMNMPRFINSDIFLRSASISKAESDVLKAVKYGAWTDLYLHSIEAGGDITTNEWQTFLSFLYDYGIPVKTYTQIISPAGIPTNK